MKILAIHSNKIFFQGTLEEDVPDFYEWLSRERGVSGRFRDLDEEYKKNNKENSPLLLRKIYKVAAAGLSEEELFAYCGKYNEFYFNKEMSDKMAELRKTMNVLILTSFPIELFEHLLSNGEADKVFGATGKIDSSGRIADLKEIELKYPGEVIEKMKETGLGFEFTLEPDRYGLLEILIDYMIETGSKKDEVTLVGKNMSSMPFTKMSGRQIDNLM